MIKKYFHALAVFVGTVIGVGMFGLPYVAAKSGLWVVGWYFLLLVPTVVMLELCYARVACGSKKLMRLPGYADKYLGIGAKRFALIISLFSLLGSELAYLIIGGTFLQALFTNVFKAPFLIFVWLFFIFGAVLIYFGIKSISGAEAVLLGILIGILVLFCIFAGPYFSFDTLFAQKSGSVLLPYGVLLFALWGSSIIPELKDMIGNYSGVRRLLGFGTLGIALLYLLFIVIIFGVTGAKTTQDALTGFALIVGGRMILLGFLFGIIAVFTSFITIGLTIKKMLWYDFGLHKDLSWAIACFIPLLLLILGMRSFIDIIGLLGAVAIGFEAVLIVLLYRSFVRKKGQSFSWLLYCVLFLLSIGVLLGIITF